MNIMINDNTNMFIINIMIHIIIMIIIIIIIMFIIIIIIIIFIGAGQRPHEAHVNAQAAVPTKLNVSHLESKVNKPGYSMVCISLYIYIYICMRSCKADEWNKPSPSEL